MTTTRLLKLTSDVVFKEFMISGNIREYKARLIHLIPGLDEDKLLKVKYVCKEFSVNHKKDKTYKSDIVVNVDFYILNIEINASYYDVLFEKNNTYMNKIRSEIFDRGDSYLNIEKVIQINIDNFSHYKGDKLIYKFEMREEDAHELECTNIESYHIDLENLQKICHTNSERKELEKLLMMFIAIDESKLEEYRSDQMMNDAINELERISQDEKIIGLYDAEVVERKIKNTQIESARRQEKLQIAKSLNLRGVSLEEIIEVTGLNMNHIDEDSRKFLSEEAIDTEAAERKIKNTQIEVARRQGIEQGEQNRNLQIAKNLKLYGMSLDDISKVTNLSIEKIEML